MMNGSVPDRLREIVRSNGIHILNNPRRVHAFLNDLCPSYQLEANILISSLEDGILPEIFNILLLGNKKEDLYLLSQRLENNLGLSKQSAHWAIETWVDVLSIYLEKIPVSEWKKVIAPAFGLENKVFYSNLHMSMSVQANGTELSDWIEIGSTPGSLEIPDMGMFRINCCDINDDDCYSLETDIFTNPRLVFLDLSHSFISDLGLVSLKKAQSITHLDLSWCDKVNGNGFTVFTDLPNVTYLNLEECRRLSDIGLEHLSKLRSLTTLNLAHCHRITESGLTSISKITKLMKLDLSGCWQFTNSALVPIGEIMSLNYLALGGCSQISDDGIKELRNLSYLEQLDISGCYQISPKMLAQLKHIPKLNVVY